MNGVPTTRSEGGNYPAKIGVVTMFVLLAGLIGFPQSENSAMAAISPRVESKGNAACSTCHLQSSPNVKNVFNVISTPIGRKQVLFNRISAAKTVTTGVFGNDQRPDPTRSTNVCEVCHHRTVQHQYSSNKAQGGPVGLQSPYNKDHHNSEDCMQCHPHNQAFKNIKGVCGDCHGRRETAFAPYDESTMVVPPTGALGGTPPDYGAHQRHHKEQVECSACHNNANHLYFKDSWVGDAKIDMGFRISTSTFKRYNPAASPKIGGTYTGNDTINSSLYSWNAAPGTTINTQTGMSTCSVYCHGGWAGNAGFNTAPNWTGANQSGCGACHYADNTNPPTTGSHQKHASNGVSGIGMTCDRCHGAFANLTSGRHVNGNVSWNLSAIAASAKYSGQNIGSTNAPAPSANYGQCTNLYCHSNVQGATGTGGPTFYATPKWGDPSTAACGSCHSYLPTTGGHIQHTNDPVTAFDCHICHNTGGTTNPGSHANGTINMAFVGLGKNTQYLVSGVPTSAVTPGTAYGRCSNSDCHGRYTRNWGPSTGLTLCEKCHGSRTSVGGFYNTAGPGSTQSVYTSSVGVHDIHLQQTHAARRATFARFTSYNSGYNCNQCHFTPTGPYSQGHMDTALPAEVRFTHLSSIGQNATKYGNYTTLASYNGDRSCSNVWCHGGGMNSNTLSGPYATVVDDAASVGATLNLVTPVVPRWNTPYLTGNAASDCTKCHNYPPPAPTASYQHYGKTLTDCTTCHGHVNANATGFKNKALHADGKVDGGCTGCHGYPPIDSTVGTSTGLATPATGAMHAGVKGAHNTHQLNPAIGNTCQTCHNGYNPAMPSQTLDIGFNALGGKMTSGTFTGYSGLTNNERFVSSSAGTTVLRSPNLNFSNTCSNVYCHGGGTATLPALGGGSNTAPDWELTGATEVGCGTCHGTTSTTAPVYGSHNRHARNDQPGRLGIACADCHGARTNNYHVNGQVEWKLNRAVLGAGATYGNQSTGFRDNLAPSATYLSCTNVYCHSNAQGAGGIGAPTSYKTVQWGSAALNCGSCHADMATDTVNATGSHKKHANTTGSGLGRNCTTCHNDGGKDTPTHADGQIFVNFTTGVGGTYTGNGRLTGSAGGYGSCSSTFCHGSANLKTAPTWGAAGPLACNACHSAKVDDTTWSGRHATHYNYSTMPATYTSTPQVLSTTTKYRYSCQACHDPDVTKHGIGPADPGVQAANVFFGFSGSRRGAYVAGTTQVATDNGFYWTDGTCSTSYCHSNGQGGNPLVTTATWASPAGTLTCTGCHDGKSTGAATTLSGKHDNHMNPATNTSLGLANGLNCVDCHAKTVTNPANNVIANKSKHVNVLVDYSGVRAGGSSRYSTATKSCTNIYCHSNGNPGAIVFVRMTGSKVWNGSASFGCNGCHGRSTTNGAPDYAIGGAGTVSANGHYGQHVAASDTTTVCANCHVKTANKTVAGKFVDYTAAGFHLNGTPNVYFRSTIGATASFNQGLGQCSNVVCHGSGTPTWGNKTATPTCQKCHGYRSTPWNALDGSTTGAKVGNHFNHISSATYKYARPITCKECHSDSIALSTDSANATAHFNSAGTAKVNWSVPANAPLATNGTTPTYNGTTCANTYCHGATLPDGFTPTKVVPTWNTPFLAGTSADCGKCHGYPPNDTATLGNHTTAETDCHSCHPHVASNNISFSDPTLHMNGVVNAAGGSCTGCHATARGNRPAIVGQFATGSHHVQGVTLTNAHCYQCHWEAADTNGTRSAYHTGSSLGAVNLVVWQAGVRPTNFQSGVTYVSYTAGNRATAMNNHCLSCHSATGPANPFSDGRSPSSYAWDSRSIDERYSQTGTTSYSLNLYSTATGRTGNSKKNITKAYSAHGNAGANTMGWSTATGYDGAVTNFTGSIKVVCYDCHNSHGSNVTGVTSSYSSATGRNKGALLKSVTAGIGGSTATYSPVAGGSSQNHNIYNPGAALCFDCHNTKTNSTTVPWGYNSTFGASQAINGYLDTPYFGNYSVNTTKRYAYKGNNGAKTKPVGGHFGASTTLDTAAASPINGLCTPCHDPHGVTPNTAKIASQQYGVPLLKGTWVTSPYQEDAAAVAQNRGGGSRGPVMSNGGTMPGYKIDQNSLQANRATVAQRSGSVPATDAPSFGLIGATNAKSLQTTTAANFAGLCTTCHLQANLTNSSQATTANWRTKQRVHQSVAGWAAMSSATGNGRNLNNRMHAYTCSKCHTPHVSRLPRLMVTNCLDVTHRNRVVSGGSVAATNGNSATTNVGNLLQTAFSTGKGGGRFPGGGARYSGTRTSARYPGPWGFGATGSAQASVNNTQYGSDCHQSSTAAGTTYNPTTQRWNSKTPW